MKDKLEHNMYVRTKWGIAKIIEISEEIIYVDTCFQPIDETKCYKEDIIGEPSFNLIDLIEEGDYVNGSEVLNFENRYIEEDDKFVPIGVITENCYLENTDSWIIEKDIKSIVTKEQFYSMEYRLGDE